jgi:4-hydroxy-tetrahydrodipicolinate reductase
MTAAPEPLPIAIAGRRGRMGQAVAALLSSRADLRLAGGFDRGTAEETAAALRDAAVVIDFTSGAASTALAEQCAEAGRPALVIGSTGFRAEQDAAVRRAAERIPIVRAGNFSIGVNLLLGLVEQAARSLGPRDYDIEILEAHHRRKADAPSGTALMLGEAAARGRGAALDEVAVRVRDGLTGPRPDGAIGFAALRGGGIVGEHSVLFAADDELITFSHSARDRALFARGALTAAAWVHGRPPGLYDMQNVLGLRG